MGLASVFVELFPGEGSGNLGFLSAVAEDQGQSLPFTGDYLEVPGEEAAQVLAMLPVTLVFLPSIGNIGIHFFSSMAKGGRPALQPIAPEEAAYFQGLFLIGRPLELESDDPARPPSVEAGGWTFHDLC